MCAIMRAVFTNHISKESNIRFSRRGEGWGGGVSEWFGLGKFFFPSHFSATSLYARRDNFSLWRIFVSQVFPSHILLSLQISFQDIFFLKSPIHNPLPLPPPPPLTQKSNGRKLTCSPALPKQRLLLLLVLESILQILHYKTVLVNYLLSYFLSYPKILTVGFAANYNKAFP